MWPLAVVVLVTVAALALRRSRWAALSLLVSRVVYALFILLGLLYFPARGGSGFRAPVCEWTFDLDLAAHSLTNYPHIVMFTIFYLLTYAQLRGVAGAATWSAAATVTFGLLVELAQGAADHGNCRMRDLIPDAAGALIGLLLVAAGARAGSAWARRRARA